MKHQNSASENPALGKMLLRGKCSRCMKTFLYWLVVCLLSALLVQMFIQVTNPRPKPVRSHAKARHGDDALLDREFEETFDVGEGGEEEEEGEMAEEDTVEINDDPGRTREEDVVKMSEKREEGSKDEDEWSEEKEQRHEGGEEVSEREEKEKTREEDAGDVLYEDDSKHDDTSREGDDEGNDEKKDKHDDDDGDKEDDDEEEEDGDEKSKTGDESQDEVDRLEQSPYIYTDEKDRKRQKPQESDSAPMKYIAAPEMWYPNFAEKGDHTFSNCPYNRCAFTEDLTKADVVLFAASSIRDHKIPKWSRPKKQRWMFVTIDPATKWYRLGGKEVKSTFNWTATYQLHSEIPMLMGMLYSRTPPKKDYDAIYERKKKLAAWFVSNCKAHSRRGEYVERMQSVADIDIFGECGPKKCGTKFGNKKARCLPLLSKSYKFYLAYESSFCKDYVTEKFFKVFEDVDVIPVVRGGVDYNKLFPKCFVNAADFKSPEELTKYLVKLGNDKKAYVKMLKEKDRWGAFVPKTFFQCDLCKKLHTSNSTDTIPSLHVRFHGTTSKPQCHTPDDL